MMIIEMMIMITTKIIQIHIMITIMMMIGGGDFFAGF